MTKDKTGVHELSVEEILKSIRNVINNHTIRSDRVPDVHSTEDRDLMDDDVLELIDEHTVDDQCYSSDCDDFDDEVEIDEINQLVSDSVASEVSKTLQDFASQSKTFDSSSFKKQSDKTVEELVVEIIKPELSKWLNVNLPRIVRELVAKEISHINPRNC
jgi:cell pole-organizing protein PopZ